MRQRITTPWWLTLTGFVRPGGGLGEGMFRMKVRFGIVLRLLSLQARVEYIFENTTSHAEYISRYSVYDSD